MQRSAKLNFANRNLWFGGRLRWRRFHSRIPLHTKLCIRRLRRAFKRSPNGNLNLIRISNTEFKSPNCKSKSTIQSAGFSESGDGKIRRHSAEESLRAFRSSEDGTLAGRIAPLCEVNRKSSSNLNNLS